MQCHQGQSALPRLTALLQSVGLSICKREAKRLLTEKHDVFLDETLDALRAGLHTSPSLRRYVANATSIAFTADHTVIPAKAGTMSLGSPLSRR